MTVNEINITFDGFDPSDALRDYTLDKLSKHENFLDEATSAKVIFVEEVHKRGVAKDFKVTMNVVLPGKTMHVEEAGPDMYKLVDTASDILFRRIRKMQERQIEKDR